VPVPFVPILIGLLVLAALILVLVGLRMRGSLLRFGSVREALSDHVTDRTGMLRARSAALGVAMSDLRQDLRGHRSVAGAPRTIGSVVEREDHRA
jgi:hypothetical protein